MLHLGDFGGPSHPPYHPYFSFRVTSSLLNPEVSVNEIITLHVTCTSRFQNSDSRRKGIMLQISLGNTVTHFTKLNSLPHCPKIQFTFTKQVKTQDSNISIYCKYLYPSFPFLNRWPRQLTVSDFKNKRQTKPTQHIEQKCFYYFFFTY